MLNLTGASDAWIGLYRTRLWSDQHKTTYENWRPATSYSPAQPDNGLYVFWEHGNQQCTAVSLERSGQWTDENCLNIFPFICYQSEYIYFFLHQVSPIIPPISSLASYIFIFYFHIIFISIFHQLLKELCTGSLCNHRYHFIAENKTWSEAQSYCRVNYTDLATINNMKDMEKLLDMIHDTYSGLAWIGLYDDLASWKWSLDDDSFYMEAERSFRNWFVYKQRNWFGNSLCAYFSGFDTIWWGASCYSSMAFVCFDGECSRHTCLAYKKKKLYCAVHFSSENIISVLNYFRKTQCQ